jgi:sugar phosphate isomerase/epimerase
MKIGINLWNWTKDPCKDLAGLVLHVAFLGFGAVELPLNRVSEWDYSGIAKSLRKTGLELTLCAQLSNDLDGSSLDEGTRQQTIQYLQNGLEVGAKLGAKVLAGPLYGGSGKLSATQGESSRTQASGGHAFYPLPSGRASWSQAGP